MFTAFASFKYAGNKERNEMKSLIIGRKGDSNVGIIKDIVLVLVIIALCVGVYLIFIKPLNNGQKDFIDPYKICFGKLENSVCSLNGVSGTCQNGMCVANDKPAYSRDEAITMFKTTFKQKLVAVGTNKACQNDVASCPAATETLKNILQYTKFEEESSQTFILVRKEPDGRSTFMLSDKGTFFHAIDPTKMTNLVMSSFQYNQGTSADQSMCLLKKIDNKDEKRDFEVSRVIGIAKNSDGFYMFDINGNKMEYCSFISLRHLTENDPKTALCIYYNDDCQSQNLGPSIPII